MKKYLNCEETNIAMPDPEILSIFSSLSRVGFFNSSVLIGTWAMFIYRVVYGFEYVLRTGDIDIAIQVSLYDKNKKLKTDIRQLLIDHGATVEDSNDGSLEKIITHNYYIEFISGARSRLGKPLFVREWNVTAQRLDFINMLLDFSIRLETDYFYIRIPTPEAFFLHKLIVANKRPDKSKRLKDLEQCSLLVDIVDGVMLKKVVSSQVFSPKTRSKIKSSCEMIDFPYDRIDQCYTS